MTAEGYVREVYGAPYLRLVVQILALTGDLADAQEAFVKALAQGLRAPNSAGAQALPAQI